ncbi:DUF6957 family protein [Pseudomonas donghuensis]|uniref:DUF6957 family protein n=1 Tax=Pseudomonas donghuensis TaxID=1163398 RepID=UPI0020C2544C|nr:hypothetical protein [Pseudomonas donghuensis]MCP6699359.1 hypothetical protein [Pseudomonas donghuensis]
MESNLIADILYGEARNLSGSSLSDDDLIRIVQDEFSYRAVCVVRQWLLLDVLLPECERAEIEAEGRQPTIIYAHNVVFDSRKCISAGDGLVTDYEREFYGCLFETGDVLVVLAGFGGRKYVSQPAMAALKNPDIRSATGLLVHDL